MMRGRWILNSDEDSDEKRDEGKRDVHHFLQLNE